MVRGGPGKGVLSDKGLNEERKNVLGRMFQTVKSSMCEGLERECAGEFRSSQEARVVGAEGTRGTRRDQGTGVRSWGGGAGGTQV